jgi:hypothetical protein
LYKKRDHVILDVTFHYVGAQRRHKMMASHLVHKLIILRFKKLFEQSQTDIIVSNGTNEWKRNMFHIGNLFETNNFNK